MPHPVVPIPRRLIDQVLAVIPTTRPASADRLALRLVVEGGMLPRTVVSLTVDAVQLQGNQAQIRILVGRTTWTLRLTDRTLVHDLAAHLRTHCLGRYLFLEPHTKAVRGPDAPDLVPPPDPDHRPMTVATLLRRWQMYCLQADVSLSLESLVRLHAEARRRRRCPQADVAALRQELRALRSQWVTS
jgi:integrase